MTIYNLMQYYISLHYLLVFAVCYCELQLEHQIWAQYL